MPQLTSGVTDQADSFIGCTNVREVQLACSMLCLVLWRRKGGNSVCVLEVPEMKLEKEDFLGQFKTG